MKDNRALKEQLASRPQEREPQIMEIQKDKEEFKDFEDEEQSEVAKLMNFDNLTRENDTLKTQMSEMRNYLEIIQENADQMKISLENTIYDLEEKLHETKKEKDDFEDSIRNLKKLLSQKEDEISKLKGGEQEGQEKLKLVEVESGLMNEQLVEAISRIEASNQEKERMNELLAQQYEELKQMTNDKEELKQAAVQYQMQIQQLFDENIRAAQIIQQLQAYSGHLNEGFFSPIKETPFEPFTKTGDNEMKLEEEFIGLIDQPQKTPEKIKEEIAQLSPGQMIKKNIELREESGKKLKKISDELNQHDEGVVKDLIDYNRGIRESDALEQEMKKKKVFNPWGGDKPKHLDPYNVLRKFAEADDPELTKNKTLTLTELIKKGGFAEPKPKSSKFGPNLSESEGSQQSSPEKEEKKIDWNKLDRQQYKSVFGDTQQTTVERLNNFINNKLTSKVAGALTRLKEMHENMNEQNEPEKGLYRRFSDWLKSLESEKSSGPPSEGTRSKKK